MNEVTITKAQLEAALGAVWPFRNSFGGISTELQVEAMAELWEELQPPKPAPAVKEKE
jgi:hypothetical protein